MLRFKEGVKLDGLKSVMLKCIDTCNDVYDRQGVDCTVRATEANAIELRSWHINDKETTVKNLRRALGKDFNVVIEKDHIYVEHKIKIRIKNK